ncbi:MAG: ActS/PrrB/RegB family redox-sensitive histidine kinase [Pseudomonadota bacterium]
MTDIALTAPLAANFWTTSSRVSHRTLIFLRWLAVTGQTIAVLFVRFGIDNDFPVAGVMAVIGMSAAFNLTLMAVRPLQGLALEWEAVAQLGFDVVQLAVLLAMTGGLQNPFVFLFVAPVAVSATVLRPAVTAMLAALTFLCVGAISMWRLPLPWPGDPNLELPPLYQLGVAASVLVGLGFTSVYAWRVAAEEERLNIALSAVQAVLAREQKLSALGALAAAAAHELGTPLATIHLVAKEMARALPSNDPHAEDAQLLVSQSERCRSILAQLSNRRDEVDAMHARAPVRALLEEIAAPHEGLGAAIIYRTEGDGSIELKRLPEIVHALGAIVENAVGFAETRVDIDAHWTSDHVEIAVIDDGPGFAPGVLARLGEPYLTEREAGAAGGLGLGFFIAKTLLERTGAKIMVKNRADPEHGAIVRARWPRAAIEAPPL